jgi:hypothetical protein
MKKLNMCAWVWSVFYATGFGQNGRQLQENVSISSLPFPCALVLQEYDQTNVFF